MNMPIHSCRNLVGVSLVCLGSFFTPAHAQATTELILASRENHSILRYDLATRAFLGSIAVGGPLRNPADVTVRPNGNVLVANFNGIGSDVLEYSRDGTLLRNLNSDFIEETTAVKVLDGRIYALSNDTRRVGVFDDATGNYLYDFASDGGVSINFPADMEFGPNNELYITVEMTNRIQVWNPLTGTFIRSFGSEVSFADGLTFGPDNLLYVSDFANDQIKRFDPITGAFIDVFVASVNDPGDLGFGPDGALYVTQFFDKNVLRFDGVTGALIGEVVPAFGAANWPTGFDFYIVPEPATLTLLSAGALLTLRRRRSGGACEGAGV